MDELLKLEEAFRSEGAREGFERGVELGAREGRDAGFAEGAARGLERQFAAGVADALLALGDNIPQRARSAARELSKLAKQHEMHILGNIKRDIDEDQKILRHQLRLALALARMPPIRPCALQQDPALSF